MVLFETETKICCQQSFKLTKKKEDLANRKKYIHTEVIFLEEYESYHIEEVRQIKSRLQTVKPLFVLAGAVISIAASSMTIAFYLLG